ncbi:MAG: FtsX-like permease family protein [Bacteroidales bacterium]|nr:FtsX-like permease family protein [Bacteroidales bacterium]MCF8404928.1 FtsX-like permease family protein [Bacteroidales bacterium]
MINIISAISVLGVAVGTFALIVVLSVFNGFEDLVKSLYSAFDPDIKITAVEGKSFSTLDLKSDQLAIMKDVLNYTEVVEENALLKYRSEQNIVTMKGVSEGFLENNPMQAMLVDGDFVLEYNKNDFAIMGYLVAYHLGIRIYDGTNPLIAYVPRRTKKAITSFDQSFNTGTLVPSAVFSIQQEIDSKYIIVPIDFAQNLLEYGENEVTAIELRLAPEVDLEDFQKNLQKTLGPDYSVKNKYQQQELLYKIMKSEKWAIFLILTFILIIAAFNVVGSLSMLILDKRKDIGVLYSMGASKRLIKRIFMTEGLLVSSAGAVIGLVMGFVVCWAQMEFGIVKLGEANAFLVPYYPVQMKFFDFLLVFATVFIIGFLSAAYPVKQIAKKYLGNRITEFTKTQ